MSLLVAVLISALAPIFAVVLPGPKLPPVVFMILGGIIVGPQVLAWGDPSDLHLLADLGLGFLFLLAGYEIDPQEFRQEPGRLAVRSWGISAALGLGLMAPRRATGVVPAPFVVAIGLTTTALGTLIPILRDSGLMNSRLGGYIFSAGAVGELFPIIAMALFLGTRGVLGGLLSLMALGLWALGIVKVIDIGTARGWGRRLGLAEHSTGQATLRWTIVVLVVLVVVAGTLSIDIVMGAVLAGMVLRYWSPGDVPKLEQKLDAVGYGVFIPVFFVASGMALDIRAIADSPTLMLLFFALLLVVRGLPHLWVYRKVLGGTERWQIALFGATALPLLVALTTIAVGAGVMSGKESAALVGAGVLSVIVFPTAAVRIGRGSADRASQSSADAEAAAG